MAAHTNITRRKLSERELAHQASHDPLTGLANRLLFAEACAVALRLHPERPPVADVGLLYIDLDDFKPGNDCFGHGAGDEVLLTTAHRLRGLLRPQDTATR